MKKKKKLLNNSIYIEPLLGPKSSLFLNRKLTRIKAKKKKRNKKIRSLSEKKKQGFWYDFDFFWLEIWYWIDFLTVLLIELKFYLQLLAN